jgi:hypothetical protein
MSLRLGLGIMVPASARPTPTSAPANTVAPSITGALTQGQTLTANPGSWTGLPSGAFAYQWQRSGTNIGGATSSTYVAQAADVSGGAGALTVEVTATNVIGSTMAESAGVTIAGPLTLTGTPGGPIVGNAYTFTPTSTGGHTPKSYALTGTLPSGLSFNMSTGAITGTPLASGTASGLNITVTDNDSLTTALGTFSLVVTTVTGIAWLNSVEVLGDITVDNTGAPDVPFYNNGWLLRVTTNQPTLTYATVDATKVVLTVEDYGWATDGTQTTHTRTVTGTARVNKSYPDITDFTDDDQAAGVIEFALDEQLYNSAVTDSSSRVYKSTIVNVAFGLGFFTVGATPSAAGDYTGALVVRSDSKNYPKPIGHQIEAPRAITRSGTLTLNWQFVHEWARNNSQVACVEAWGRVSGVDGPVTRASSMTELSYTSGSSPSGLTAGTYTTALDLSSFADGDVGIRGRVKPWIGPEVNSYDTGIGHDWSTKQAIGWLAEYPAVKESTPANYIPVYAWVNQDGTGLTTATTGVSTSASDPGPSNSYQTPQRAIAAIQAYRLATYSKNNVDAGVVMLRPVVGSTYGQNANSYSTRATNLSATVDKVPLTIRASNSVLSDEVRWRGALPDGTLITTANKSASGVSKIRFEHIKFDATNSSQTTEVGNCLTFGGSVTSTSATPSAQSWYEFHNCKAESHSATSTSTALVGMQLCYHYNSEMIEINGGIRSGFGGLGGTAAAIGSKFVGQGTVVDGIMTVASVIQKGTIALSQTDAAPNIPAIRQMVMYNSRLETTTTNQPAFGVGSTEGAARMYEMVGIAMVGNIFARFDNLGNALAYPAGDNSLNPFDNWVFQNNSNGGAGGFTNESPHRWNTIYGDKGFYAIRKEASARWNAFARTVSKTHDFNDDPLGVEVTAWNSGAIFYWGKMVFDNTTGGGTVATGATVYQAIVPLVPAATALSNTAYWHNCGAPGTASVGPQPYRNGNRRWRMGVNSKGNVNGGSVQSEADHGVGVEAWMSDIRFPLSGTNGSGSKWGHGDVSNYYVADLSGEDQSANIGLSDYHPNPLGDLIGMRPAGYAVDPFDMLGTARDNDVSGSAGALEIIPDTTPDAFSFTDVTGADLSTVTTSGSVTPTGYNTAASITATGGTVSVEGGSFTASTTISPGQSFVARVTSSGSSSTAVNCVVTIGGATSDTFTVTTSAAGAVPSISVAPAITGMNPLGTATPNAVLTCSTGTWSGSPSSYAYQWKLAGSNVGTNANTYTSTDVSDAAKAITCEVTASNVNGASAPAASNSVNTFNPAELSPFAVFDAEKTSQLALTGSNVTSWTASGSATLIPTDLSGTLAQPQYSATSFNGRPGVTGNGTTQYLEVTTGISGMPTGSTACEIWVIANQPDADSVTNTRHFGGWGNTATTAVRARSIYKTRTSTIASLTILCGNGSGVDVQTLTPAASGFVGRHVARGVWSGTTFTPHLDGVAGTANTETTNTLAARFRLFADPTNSGGGPVQFYSNATINAYMVLPILTADQITAMTAWCNQRKA